MSGSESSVKIFAKVYVRGLIVVSSRWGRCEYVGCFSGRGVLLWVEVGCV